MAHHQIDVRGLKNAGRPTSRIQLFASRYRRFATWATTADRSTPVFQRIVIAVITGGTAWGLTVLLFQKHPDSGSAPIVGGILGLAAIAAGQAITLYRARRKRPAGLLDRPPAGGLPDYAPAGPTSPVSRSDGTSPAEVSRRVGLS